MRRFISVARLRLAAGADLEGPNGPGALFVLQGVCEEALTGEGMFLPPNARITSEDGADVLVFALTVMKPDGELLGCEEIEGLSSPCLLRLDEVSFPPGAVAYRHVHSGPGFRYLRHGSLHLQADDHAFDAAPGEVWFEPAHSPVRATADPGHAETRFVRFMVLPTEYLGKPTINILDPEDAERPRHQTTHRHVDRIVEPPQDDAG